MSSPAVSNFTSPSDLAPHLNKIKTFVTSPLIRERASGFSANDKSDPLIDRYLKNGEYQTGLRFAKRYLPPSINEKELEKAWSQVFYGESNKPKN